MPSTPVQLFEQIRCVGVEPCGRRRTCGVKGGRLGNELLNVVGDNAQHDLVDVVHIDHVSHRIELRTRAPPGLGDVEHLNLAGANVVKSPLELAGKPIRWTLDTPPIYILLADKRDAPHPICFVATPLRIATAQRIQVRVEGKPSSRRKRQTEAVELDRNEAVVRLRA